MEPIPFPSDAAAAAAARCRSMAGLVNDKMTIASTAAGPARTGWTGGHADDFNVAWPDTEMSATELIERLNRVAADIEAAAGAAVAENRRRAELRSEFDRESRRGRAS
jgi:hypothetical protein